MTTPKLFLAALLGLAAASARAETLDQSFARAQTTIAQAAAPQTQTRTRSEYTDNQVPLRIGQCSAPVHYKDAIERPRVKMELEVAVCKEKATFEERAEGQEGRGIFKRTKWVRVPGSEKLSYEQGLDTEDFDLSYDPDSFRTRETILRDLKDACEARRRELTKRLGPSRCP